MADTLDLFRRIATLEVELRIEKEQHSQAQQTILYLLRQLSTSPAPKADRNVGPIQQRPAPSQQEHVVAQPQNTAAPTTQYIPTTRYIPVAQNMSMAQNIGVQAQHDESQMQHNYLQSTDIPVTQHKETQARRNVAQMQHSDFQAHLNHIKAWTRAEEFKPASHGVNASKWAHDRSSELVKISGDSEEKIKKHSPVVEDDLIRFPEDFEESDATESGKIAPLDEAGERERQKEMMRTQAMLMFRPVAEHEKSFRTVIATGIPSTMTVHEVMSLVSGGIIVSIQAMHTSPITGTESIMITFLHASAARNFVESAKDNKIPKFALLNTPTWPLNRDLLDDITGAKNTRCLVIYNVDPDIPLDSLCTILAESGTNEHGIIHANRDSGGTVFLHFVSIGAARKAYERARRHPWFRIARIEFEADPCDWVAAKGQKTIKEDEMGAGEVEKEVGVGAEEEAQVEGEGDTEDDEKEDAGAGRKMDDHQIADILADAY